MFVSVRRKFRKGDQGWREYTGLPHLSEVRTIDYLLSGTAPHSWTVECTPETLAQALDEIPPPNSNDQYYLLAIDILAEPEFVARLPAGWKLMGYDLADWTGISSLHNCGHWEGQLEPLTRRLNDVGLLSLEDAELARKLLPLEWGENMDHTKVTIWALYERELAPG